MNKDSGINLKMLQVSGGMSKNKCLLQMQADLLGIPVGKKRIFMFYQKFRKNFKDLTI